jgi:hypothetical protein
MQTTSDNVTLVMYHKAYQHNYSPFAPSMQTTSDNVTCDL